ncbi:MAG: hypothetical protein IJX53_03045 [Clostridia bacterium]|nr:hypothetical protein [Clostridia bacterium]
MQKTAIPAPEVIARRSSPAYIRLRITGQYLGLYLLAFLFGVVLCSLLDAAALPALDGWAAAHFTSPFAAGDSLPDCAAAILDSASGDIRSMFLILTAGFTLFCPLALSVLTAWRGFSLGFVAAWLGSALSAGTLQMSHGAGAFLLFLGANGLVAAAFVHLAAQAVYFSHEYRAICGRPKKILRSPFVWRYLFVYLTMFGFVMLVHGAYCGLCALV